MSSQKLPILVAIFITLSVPVHADVSKVYHPYVEPLEREIELMALQSFDDVDQHETTYSMGYGQAVRENIFLELSGQAYQNDHDGFDIEDWELEGLIQLSEQGAGPVDYGVLVEIEREVAENVWETGAALLMESEWGQSSLAANLGIAYEFGGGIDNEYDRFARLQWRYRLQPGFEPAFEVHLDEYDEAAGPAALGTVRLGGKQKLKWELALLFALDDETPSSMLKAALELEF